MTDPIENATDAALVPSVSNSLLQLRPQGLYCAKGDFYIDPWKPVERAVVTHGHADHAHHGSKHYWAHPHTLAIMNQRFPSEFASTPLEYRQTIRMGDVDMALYPAGHILGSSQVFVTDGTERWAFTGDFKMDADPSCEPFESVACDTFISEATFALPIYNWRPTADIVKDIHTWWKRNAAQGVNSLLFCYSLGKAQRVLAELALLGVTDEILLHGAALSLTDIYAASGVKLPPYRKVRDDEKPEGALVIAPPAASGSTWARRFGDYESAFASGWMQVRGNRRRRNYEKGFVVSDHADWNGLIEAIRLSTAKRVLLTHGYSDALVTYLQSTGLVAEALRTEYGEEEVA